MLSQSLFWCWSLESPSEAWQFKKNAGLKTVLLPTHSFTSLVSSYMCKSCWQWYVARCNINRLTLNPTEISPLLFAFSSPSSLSCFLCKRFFKREVEFGLTRNPEVLSKRHLNLTVKDLSSRWLCSGESSSCRERLEFSPDPDDPDPMNEFQPNCRCNSSLSSE